MATENEQRINEMRVVQSDLFTNLAKSTAKAGGSILGIGVGLKIVMSVLKTTDPQYENVDSPIETIAAIGIYTGLALGTITYILEDASRNIVKKLPKELQTMLNWDRIKSKG